VYPVDTEGVTRGPDTGRRPGRPGYDPESLLAVAVRVFNERGYDGTSIQQLADRLGISKSAIYHHVSGKQELLAAALNRALNALEVVAERVRRSERPAVERLESLVRGSVQALVEQLPSVTLLLRVRGNSETERAALDRRRVFDKFAAELVLQAQLDGDIRPDADPAVTARLVFGMVNSVAEWFRPADSGSVEGRTLPDRGDSSAITDTLCRLAFDGLRPRPADAVPADARRT